MTAMFADDTTILATDEDQQTATDQLQRTLNNVSNWTKRWIIKINSEKSVHVNYTLRKSVSIQYGWISRSSHRTILQNT